MAREIPFEKVQDLIAKELGVEKGEITRETNLYQDLGIDSLGIVSLGIRLQSELKVNIPPAVVVEVRNVGEFYEQLKKLVAEQG